MNFNVVLSYKDAGLHYKRWASEEALIDFKQDPEGADRCTVSYAACELCTYLEKLGHEVTVSDKKTDGKNITINVLSGKGEEFDLTKRENDLQNESESFLIWMAQSLPSP